MHYTKRIITAALAAVPVYSAFAAGPCADAVDAPTDIHLTVQTKEIAVQDIPEDRIVTLDIYQENCPFFDAIMFPVIKDPRLSYYPDDDCFGLAEGVRNARTPNISFYVPDPDYRMCDICSSAENDDFIEFDNAIATVSFKLPEQVETGDFFTVKIIEKYLHTPIQINFGDRMEDVFNESAFSQLNSGGIRIVQGVQPAPAPNEGGGQSPGGDGGDNGGGGDPSPGEVSQSGDDHNTPRETPAAVQTVTAAPATSTAAPASSAAMTNTTSTVLSTSSTSSYNSTTGSSAASSAVSTSANAVIAPKEDPENKNKGGFIMIALITLIIVAVASTALLAEKLRMNRK
jgi:hypothetical protein